MRRARPRRDASFFNGLNQQLRRIEFNSNLAYGTLSDPNNTDKTAEEILECLSAEEVAQLNAITEKLILGIKDKGVNGKKKGRKAHHHHCCHC